MEEIHKLQSKWTAAARKDMQTNLEQKEDQHLLVVFVVQAVGSGQSKSVANLRREEMRSFRNRNHFDFYQHSATLAVDVVSIHIVIPQKCSHPRVGVSLFILT